MLQVVSRTYQRELVSTTNSYLLANQFGKVTFKSTVDVYWCTIRSEYSNPMSFDGTDTFTREYGSFFTDEFSIGDTVRVYLYSDDSDWVTTGTILNLSDKEMVLTSLSTVRGSNPGAFTNDRYLEIYGTTTQTAFRYSFGLIENNESVNYISKLDQNEQTFLCENLGGGSQQTANVQGYASWNTGTCKIKKIAASDPIRRQCFEIEHVFIINPFYIQGSDINIAPEWLANTNSLRHVCKYEAKPELYNPNSTHGGVDEVLKGDVGYLNENYNAIIRADGSVFTLDSVVLSKNSVTITEIDLSGTHVIMTISSSANKFSSGNTKFALAHTMLNDDATTYSNTSTTQLENFLHCRILQTAGATGGTGSLGILTNVKSSVVAQKLIVEFDLAYTSLQQTAVGNNQILLTLETQDHLKSATDNDAMVLYDYFDVATSTDDDTLLTWNDVRHFELPFEYDTNPIMGRKEVKLWLCDSVWTRAEFTTNDAKLNKVELLYRVVSGSGDIQEFTSALYDISSNVAIGNIRQVDIENTRKYILPSGDNRNDFNITMLQGETAPDQRYLFEIGSKLRWEDWIKLLNIDTEFQNDFFDITELQNNINQKWDKYKDDANWNMQLVVRCYCENSTGEQTIFENISSVDVYDFDKDDNAVPRWTCVHELFDGTTSLGTDDNAVIAPVNNTKFKATYSCSPFTLDTASLYGVLYLEEYQKGGEYKQVQINTLDVPKTNIALIPLSGETKAKLTIVNTQTVTIECLIDKSKISSDSIYSLVSRLGSTCVDTDTDEGWDSDYYFTNRINHYSQYSSFNGNNILLTENKEASIYFQNVLYSNDNGITFNTWNIINDYSAYYVLPFYFNNYYYIFMQVSGGSYELMKTADFNTFTSIFTMPLATIEGWFMKDELNIIYTINNNTIKKSIDGGLNFSTILTGASYQETIWVDNNIIINNENYGTCYVSQNNGTSFTTIQIDSLYNTASNAVRCLKYSGGFLFNSIKVSSSQYKIYKSIDLGLTWTFLGDCVKEPRDIAYNNGIYYISLFNDFCYYSTDNGATFNVLLDINGTSIIQGLFNFTGTDLLIETASQQYRYVGGYIPCEIIKDIDGYILQENGDFLLQENGDKLILEL